MLDQSRKSFDFWCKNRLFFNIIWETPMLESKRGPSVSVALIRILKDYAERMEINFPAIAGAVGVDLAVLGNNRARVSAKQFEQMWRQIVDSSKDPTPGLNFGEEMARHYPSGSILFTMMMNCATIGDALDTFVRYHRIMADAIQPQLRPDGDLIHLSWEVSQQAFPAHPYLSEALICTYHSILKHLTKGSLRPIGVYFTHAGPDDINAYRQVFKAPIRFEAEKNELVIAKEALDLEIHLANQELYEILENHADRLANSIGKENDWSSKVIRLISRMVMKGIKPNIDSVSKKLALSRRNLQAKLKSEKTTFRNCLESVRKQIAVDYLAKPDVTICDVAFLLGYSEQSAFNHAFKRWTGKNPKTYFQELN
jgi:AraC-like DNA-binding protein